MLRVAQLVCGPAMDWRVILKSLPKILHVHCGGTVPLRVSHCITYRCNLDCRYCSRHTPGDGELTTAQVRALMNSFREAGCLFWGFNGGEPLARQDLGALITHAKQLGMHVSVATNGTLIADRLGEVAAADLVNISLDGPKAVHDSLRPHSFDRIVRGLTALKKANVPRSFVTVIGRHNLNALEAILDFARDWDARVFFQPIRVQKEDRKAKAKEFFPSPEQMVAAMERLVAAKRQGRPVANSLAYLKQIQSCWPDAMPAARCWAGRIFCFVTPEGRVAACCDTMAATAPIMPHNGTDGAGDAFRRIPRTACETCYAAIPLEANLLMDSLAHSPLASWREVLGPHLSR